MQPAVARPELPTFTSANLIFNLNLRLAFWGLSQDQEKQTQQPEPLYSVVFQNEEGLLGQGVGGPLSPCLDPEEPTWALGTEFSIFPEHFS